MAWVHTEGTHPPLQALLQERNGGGRLKGPGGCPPREQQVHRDPQPSLGILEGAPFQWEERERLKLDSRAIIVGRNAYQRRARREPRRPSAGETEEEVQDPLLRLGAIRSTQVSATSLATDKND